MLKGIDISSWQGDVDFSSLAKNQDFIIIRSSYGTGYTDTKFSRNRDGCRSNNIPHGFYHYAYPTFNTPEAEADWFLSVVQPLQAGEVLFLDFEENYPTPVDWCKRFLDRVSGQLRGYKPLLYINKYMTKTYDWRPVASANYGLWLAYWDYNPDGTFEVPQWDTIAMRQYSNQLTVNGISGRVDGDVFYGDKTQFTAYGVKIEDTPCEALKLETAQLKSDLTAITKERDGLTKALSDLNGLYKTVLEEGRITNAKLATLLKDYEKLTGLFKDANDKLFKKDEELLNMKTENARMADEVGRLKNQQFTVVESITFLLNALKGGGK